MDDGEIILHNYESCFYDSPGGRLHYLHHSNPGKPVLLGLHGYKDTSRTFSFLEPLLLPNFEIYLLDWRGHGDSALLNEGYYDGPQFLGDLIAFTGTIMPKKFYLMGHSMGAAIGARFAGFFPESIQGLILLEGFSGLTPMEKERQRIRTWARSFRRLTEPEKGRKFGSFSLVIKVLSMLHRRLPPERIKVLAKYLSRKTPDGEFVWRHDPNLQSRFIPVPFSPLFSRLLWSSINCPALLFFGSETEFRPDAQAFKEARKLYNLNSAAAESLEDIPEEPLAEIMSHFKDITLKEIQDAGHNMHHDKPEQVMESMREYFQKLNLEIT